SVSRQNLIDPRHDRPGRGPCAPGPSATRINASCQTPRRSALTTRTYLGLVLSLVAPLLVGCGAGNDSHEGYATQHHNLGDPSSKVDIDLAFVRLTPELTFDAKPNRPNDGDMVTWVATIRNRGSVETGKFDVAFSADGTMLARGTVDTIAVGSQVDVG